MPNPVEISIVVPVYNEEDSLPVLYAEIAQALEAMGALGSTAEIIFVDDRSTDRSLTRLLELHERDPRVCVVRFRRNYGQTAALAAGFDVAKGRVIVTLDGDLQNDPADIPALVRELKRGFDIVAGWRKKRLDGLFLRRLPSLFANRLIAWVTGVHIHDTGCTLKAFRRELVKSMAIYAEQHRFLPVLSAGSGARISELVVNHRPRRFGQSKYGIGRATRVVLDLMAIKFISQFSQRPIQYFGTLSILTLISGFLFALVALISLDFGSGSPPPKGTRLLFDDWGMAVVTILCLVFSAFVYFALLGLLGELAVKASGMHRRSTLDRILNELH
jgi:glycosyltransferase involved in cell wall biosynthesis